MSAGSRPGGFGRKPVTGCERRAGRSAEAARIIVDDAVAMQDAGVSMLLLEAVPEEVAVAVVEATSIPVIGCGAGGVCHGQVVVLQDLAGLTRWQPSFARPISDLGKAISSVASTWMDRVATGDLGDHPYAMREGEADRLAKE